MKKIKAVLSLFLTVVMIISSFAVTSVSLNADEEEVTIVESGVCGDAAGYTIDSNGTLRVTGTGDLYDERTISNSTVKTIIIEKGITSIGQYNFWNSNSLTRVIIPNTVTEIGMYAFYKCPVLTHVTIPESVEKIASCAFTYCYKLNNVVLPRGVTTVGSYAFSYCTSMTNFAVSDTLTSWDGFVFYMTKNVIIGCIEGSYMAKRCKDVHWDYKYIKDLGVCGESLSYIYSTDNVLSIYGWGDMAGNMSLQHGWSDYRSDIVRVNLSSEMTSIGRAAFAHCTALTAITIPESVREIGFIAFDESGIYNDSSNWNNDAMYLGDWLITTRNVEKNFTIKQGTKYIANGAFSDNHKITSITLPDTVETIGEKAFEYCFITDITIPKNVVSIGAEAFFYCSYLKKVTVTEGVIDIGADVFNFCDVLKIHCYEGTYIDKYAKEYNIPVEYLCTEHTFTDYILDNNATCTENGTKTAYCNTKGCYAEDVIVIEGTALGHSFGEYISNGNATCMSDGTKSAVCERCTTVDTQTEEGTKTDCYPEDDGWHYMEDETCTEDGTRQGYCKWCKVTCITEVVPGTALGHDFRSYYYDENATCTSNGTKTAKCERSSCEETHTLPCEGTVLGHTFENYISNGDATCLDDGTESAVCIRCDVTDTRVEQGSALGHSFSNYETVSEPTCTKKGIKEAVCDNGCTAKDTCFLEPKEHIYGEWTVIEEPAYEHEGLKIRNCLVCSEILIRENIPVLIYEGFPDVWENSWYAEGIEYCFKNGYILGTDEGLFKPNSELTREQFVVILARISGAKLSEYTESPFDDIAADSWYGPSVIWANSESLVNGIGNKKFGVGQSLTREQLAVILYRYADKQGIDITKKANLSYCNDAKSISEWAVDACGWSVEVQLLGSTSETANILSPKMKVTRAQTAKIFMAFDKIK